MVLKSKLLPVKIKVIIYFLLLVILVFLNVPLLNLYSFLRNKNVLVTFFGIQPWAGTPTLENPTIKKSFGIGAPSSHCISWLYYV